jgi:peptidoglycan L-alanyl-D-glutamate endopeptidase CwlK
MISSNRAILTEGLIASEFDARLNAAFPEAYEPMDPAGALSEASALSQLTPDLVVRMFPAAPLANIKKHLPLVRRALAERGLVDKSMILMALATVRAECATFDPISEGTSPLNTEPPGPPFNKYDRRQDLGNLGPPDGARYRGRGFIQLTGRKNYKFYGSLLGYDLIGNPALANAPQPAAQILAAYLKENEPSIRSALAAGDLPAARRIVNGGLNGLDSFRSAFLAGAPLIRDRENDVALSRESHGRREGRKLKELKAASTSASASRGVKSKEKKKDDVADGKTRAKKKDDAANEKAKVKKRDDVAEEKSRAKKKDDDMAENNEPNGKKKGKGFFLFRPFRALKALRAARTRP